MNDELITNKNMETINSSDFSALLRQTYFKGAEEMIKRKKQQEAEMKKTILLSIIRAAAAGDHSVKISLPTYPTTKITKFLQEAHITWIEESPRQGGFCLAPINFTFFWTALMEELEERNEEEE